MSANTTPNQRLKEITDSIELGIADLFESDKYKQYLKTMSRFHNYSFNNTILISMQMPEATYVASFRKWSKEFSRHVKKGETAIKIIAPSPYKQTVTKVRLDPNTQQPMTNTNGDTLTEEVEKQIASYRAVSVFDLSQTEGKPLPTLVNSLTGNVEEFELFLQSLSIVSPVPISFESMPETTDGYFHPKEQRIAIRLDMSEIQTLSALIHEIAHAKLHDYTSHIEDSTKKVTRNRNSEEVEAESISYAVCNYYGIETSENAFGYIAGWSKGKELEELKESLTLIYHTAAEIIKEVDQHFLEHTPKREEHEKFEKPKAVKQSNNLER